MNTYAIRRKHAWKSPEEVEKIAARSKQVADQDFPDAHRAGMPVDVITDVAELVVIRPDPAPEPAAS